MASRCSMPLATTDRRFRRFRLAGMRSARPQGSTSSAVRSEMSVARRKKNLGRSIAAAMVTTPSSKWPRSKSRKGPIVEMHGLGEGVELAGVEFLALFAAAHS